MPCSCDGLDLDVAIFNNFYEDKAQELGLTNEEYRHRMGTIFRALSQPSRQRAIINIDSASLSFAPVVMVAHTDDGRMMLIAIRETKE